MSTLKERIMMFAREKYDMGQTKFENFTGINPGTINKIKDGVSTTTLTKIITKCPELNVRWLLLGEGEMIAYESEITKEMESTIFKALSAYHTERPDEVRELICELKILKQEKKLREQFDAEIAKKDEVIAKLAGLLELSQKKDAGDAACAVAG